MNRQKKYIATTLAAAVLGAGGLGVTMAQSADSTTTPAPAPEDTARVGTYDRISGLQAGSTSAPGVAKDAVSEETFAKAKAALDDVGGKGQLTSGRVLTADRELQTIAFWNDSKVCLRVRTPQGGGSAFCSTDADAHDPATPMYTVPERGEDGPVIALVPDTVSRVIATSSDGTTTPIEIQNNIAIGTVTKFQSLSWTVGGKATYTR